MGCDKQKTLLREVNDNSTAYEVIWWNIKRYANGRIPSGFLAGD
jgi:hypothetical protein